MQITAGSFQNPCFLLSRRDRFINESVIEEVGIQNLLREKKNITVIWLCKENEWNKVTNKGIIIEI
jgi:hypothetical protein